MVCCAYMVVNGLPHVGPILHTENSVCASVRFSSISECCFNLRSQAVSEEKSLFSLFDVRISINKLFETHSAPLNTREVHVSAHALACHNSTLARLGHNPFLPPPVYVDRTHALASFAHERANMGEAVYPRGG